ncbi:Uncharacterised protein [Actinobacillus seminis]|uniref:Uncharacterized protein n=1 Tax=Actinobacillus seminis TaxID=722 RepID=A0A380VA48_9PAST|nr:hypothetical protein [Actinobacillus seminis]SUU34052.1 Uncharacterised protein [Actinobacillus seminis]
MKLLSRKDIQASHLEKWMEVYFNEFESSITNKIRLFPMHIWSERLSKGSVKVCFYGGSYARKYSPVFEKFCK